MSNVPSPIDSGGTDESPWITHHVAADSEALLEQPDAALGRSRSVGRSIPTLRRPPAPDHQTTLSASSLLSQVPSDDSDDSVGISRVLDFLERIKSPLVAEVKAETETHGSPPPNTDVSKLGSAPQVSPLSSVGVASTSTSLARTTTATTHGHDMNTSPLSHQGSTATSSTPSSHPTSKRSASKFTQRQHRRPRDALEKHTPATPESIDVDADTRIAHDSTPVEIRSDKESLLSTSSLRCPHLNFPDQAKYAIQAPPCDSECDHDNSQNVAQVQCITDILLEAHQERQSVRSWAAQMRHSVEKWVHEQRALIHCERNSTVDQTEALCHANRQIRILRERAQKQDAKIEMLSKLMRLRPFDQRESRVPGKDEGASTTNSTGPSRDHVRGSTRVSLSPNFERSHRSVVLPTCSRRSQSSRHTRRFLHEGGTVLVYRNGAAKLLRKDGSTIVQYQNGDIKEIARDGTISYFHASEKTIRTHLPDGVDVYEYPTRQVEHHYPCGEKKIVFPDGSIERHMPSGEVYAGVTPIQCNPHKFKG